MLLPALTPSARLLVPADMVFTIPVETLVKAIKLLL